MACRTIDDRPNPATHALDRFNSLARIFETESLMDAHGLEGAEAAVLAAMGAIERAIHPLRPFGLAGDADIALEAHVGLYEARRALAGLEKRGLVKCLVGGLRWSLTDDGRARIGTTNETTTNENEGAGHAG